MTPTPKRSDAEPHYNPIFERFVTAEQSDGDRFPGMVAYCLYKIAKREWTTEHYEAHGRKPTEDELTAYIRTWTSSRVEGAKKEADGIVLSFAGSIIEANAPQIREDALRGTFWKAIGTSVLGAGLYTVILIVAIVIARVAGVDVLSIFTAVSGAPTNG